MKGTALDFRNRARNAFYYRTWPRYFSNSQILVSSVIIIGRLIYPSTQHNAIIVGPGGGRLGDRVRPASIIPRSGACCSRKLSSLD